MRLLFLAALALAACATPREGTPDGGFPSDLPGPVDSARGDVPAPPVDVGFDVLRVDVTEDRPGTVDVGFDAGAADAGADAGSADAGVCPNGRTATCDGVMVSLVNGIADDAGVRHHCGACGVTCAANEGCVSCRCEL